MRIWGCEILIWIIHMDYNFENLHDINTRKTINLFVFFSLIPLTAQWLNDDLVNKSRYVYLCLNATICCVRKYGPIEHFLFVCYCFFFFAFFLCVRKSNVAVKAAWSKIKMLSNWLDTGFILVPFRYIVVVFIVIVTVRSNWWCLMLLDLMDLMLVLVDWLRRRWWWGQWLLFVGLLERIRLDGPLYYRLLLFKIDRISLY